MEGTISRVVDHGTIVQVYVRLDGPHPGTGFAHKVVNFDHRAFSWFADDHDTVLGLRVRVEYSDEPEYGGQEVLEVLS